MEHKLIIGLGNPDPILENTYHNVGVLAVEWLVENGAKDGTSTDFRPHKGLFSYVRAGKNIFIKPLVFMNESGLAVQEAMRAFKITPEDIIVIHDDSDITVGNIKYSSGGGAAGHKGILSIIDHVKTNDFARIRIGIRDEHEEHRKKAKDFVLSPITTKDKKIFETVFEKLTLEG